MDAPFAYQLVCYQNADQIQRFLNAHTKNTDHLEQIAALIQVSSAGVLSYLHSDALGSIIATTNSSGAVTNKNKYSPFGENAPAGTTFGFTGQRYDAETGLYYYKYRYYSPVLGRFLQPDPVKYAI